MNCIFNECNAASQLFISVTVTAALLPQSHDYSPPFTMAMTTTISHNTKCEGCDDYVEVDDDLESSRHFYCFE